MNVATPTAAAVATRATPTSSPAIIHRARRTPMVMPNDNASVIHMPGVMDTTKKVGMNADSNCRFSDNKADTPKWRQSAMLELIHGAEKCGLHLFPGGAVQARGEHYGLADNPMLYRMDR